MTLAHHPVPPKALERESPVAVYLQLAQHLTDQVESMDPGDRFKTEEELIDSFGLSRTTVRRAVQQLVDRGLLVRRQGKGTFVTAKRPIQSATRLAPFVESFTAAGIKPTVKLETYQWLSGQDGVPERIRGRSESYLFLRRIYSAEGSPYSVADVYLPADVGRHVSLADVELHPIYQVIQESVGKKLHHARLRITLQRPPAPIAAFLGVEDMPYIPQLVRETYSEAGEFLECLVAHFHPKAFELEAEVSADIPPAVAYTFDRQD